MFTEPHIPDDIAELYEVYDWRHASTVISVDCPDEWEDLCQALRAFSFTERQVRMPGGSKSEIPKTFSRILKPKDWHESKLTAKRVVDDSVVEEDSHKIDFLKGRIACDLEWNSKDQTFDRDLYAFSAFWAYSRISAGVLVTRSNELDPWFAKLGNALNKDGEVTDKLVKAKYGASTTHMGKLIPRLSAGRSGGCPVLLFGITTKLLREPGDAIYS